MKTNVKHACLGKYLISIVVFNMISSNACSIGYRDASFWSSVCLIPRRG